MTNVRPNAMTSGMASWFRMATRLSFEAKLRPQAMENTNISKRSTITGATCMTRSLKLSLRTFSANSSVMVIFARFCLSIRPRSP